MFIFTSTAVGFTKGPIKVFISVDSKFLYLTTSKKTVRELLKEAQINVSDKDSVKPGLSTSLKQGMTISIQRGGNSKPSVLMGRGTIKTSRGEFRYRNVINMNATAYTAGGRYGRKTASGMRAQYGVVAVDRGTIPLGSRLYIEGYGLAIAGDVGSAIKGDRIDLFFETYNQAINFGRRIMRVYILE